MKDETIQQLKTTLNHLNHTTHHFFSKIRWIWLYCITTD